MCALNPFNFGAGLFQKFGGKFVVTNTRPPQIDTSGPGPAPAPKPGPLKPVVPAPKVNVPKLPAQLAQQPKTIG
jgi:hypothetical protein